MRFRQSKTLSLLPLLVSLISCSAVKTRQFPVIPVCTASQDQTGLICKDTMKNTVFIPWKDPEARDMICIPSTEFKALNKACHAP